jgi:hypothetical protein
VAEFWNPTGPDHGQRVAARRAHGPAGRDLSPCVIAGEFTWADGGGLGIVEASLSGLLIVAGVRPGYAILATLAYRVASYWLPLLAGPPAYLLYRHRYGRPAARRAMPRGAGSST